MIVGHLSVAPSAAHAAAGTGSTDIPTRRECRIGQGRGAVAGQLDDRRSHYLHARAAHTAALIARPQPWRGAMEIDRLTDAIHLRDRVNRRDLSDSGHELNART